MQNKKLIASIVLGILAVFSLTYGMLTPSKIRREISKGPISIKGQDAVSREAEAAPPVSRLRRSTFTSWGRDPFSSVPGASVTTAISEMSLTGILWDDEAALAMINDIPAGIGDKIGAYTIIAIQKDRVILSDGTNNFELLLSPDR